ncbi:MAG TPA: ABC transporter substrate-binding protein [Kofleriaceae bacterium]|nr:ABC transporter substrate-binding protein [Kofleriaceae bacterium]
MAARSALIAILAAVVLVPAPGHAETRPAYGGTLTASLLAAPTTLDPVRAQTSAELSVVGLVFDTLYGGGADHPPRLAAGAPVIVDDGAGHVTATIPIRQGVLFHDGSPLTANDVARSLLRLQSSPAGWLLAGVTSIAASDPHTVVMTVTRSLPVTELLAAPQTAITPGGKPPSGAHVVGSGPFELSSLDYRRHRIVLSAFDAHFAGRPYVDVLALSWFEHARDEARRYETGRAHISLRGETAFSGHAPKYVTRVLESGASVLVYVGFGQGHRGLARDIELRRAVSAAIGRGGLRHIGAGEAVIPALSPVSPAAGGNIPAASARVAHPAQARAHLAKVGQRWPAVANVIAGKGALTLEIMVDRSRPEDREVAEKLARAIYRIGLGAHIDEVAPQTFARRVHDGACDLYIDHLGLPMIASAQKAPAYWEVMAAFVAGGDPFAQKAPSTDIDALLAAFSQRLPIVPLYHRSIRAHIRGDVRGAAFSPAGRLTQADLFLFGHPEPTRAP